MECRRRLRHPAAPSARPAGAAVFCPLRVPPADQPRMDAALWALPTADTFYAWLEEADDDSWDRHVRRLALVTACRYAQGCTAKQALGLATRLRDYWNKPLSKNADKRRRRTIL